MIDGLRFVHVIHGKKNGSNSSQSFEAGKIVAFNEIDTDTDEFNFIPTKEPQVVGTHCLDG